MSVALLHHVFDSAFPIGGFVYSFGLESHIGYGDIENSDDFQAFCRHVVRYQLIPFDYAWAKKAYRAGESGDLAQVLKLDGKKSAYSVAVIREAQITLGKNLLKLNPLPDDVVMTGYAKAVKDNPQLGDETLVSAVLSARLGVDFSDFVRLHCQKTLLGFAGASLKCSRLKVSEIHQSLFVLHDELETWLANIPNSPSSFNPVFDKRQAQHAVLVPKLFKN